MALYIYPKGMTANKEHLQIEIKGFVQGLGLRPFVYRLAKKYRQYGWVANTSNGLSISIEGSPVLQQSFLKDLQYKSPPFAEIQSLLITQKRLHNFDGFLIKSSTTEGQNAVFVLPDISPCAECIAELFNPESRFYHYPFTSCCDCGARYSIMRQQPYDRIRTSMAKFSACEICLIEYSSAENRRFHSQTIACPVCGPQLNFLDKSGNKIVQGEKALTEAIDCLKQGKIIAIKGVGGFQLIVDASNSNAVKQLRLRKQRPEKPFALMVKNLASAKLLCQISKTEELALTSYASPIVLLRRLKTRQIADAVAPNNNVLGIMLPSSPLHHLLANDFNLPLVATSGNKCGEPICMTESQALNRLADIADFFVSHDRDIIRPLDDSIIRVINNKPTVLRRARGFVPMPITISQSLPEQLAVGGQMKNTVAVSQGNQLILSQHLGELDCLDSQNLFQQTLADCQHFYSIAPETVIHDLHPDYHSTNMANQLPIKKKAVQHHHAHILSCMAEHDLQPPVLGFAWDGTGLGLDNTIWGGECLQLSKQNFQRYAYFKPFPLVGGDKVANEPRRSALGLLYEIYSNDIFKHKNLDCLSTFSQQEKYLLQQSLNKQINTPYTSSVGRLFDGVSSLLGLSHINNFEGQAAMLLEQKASLQVTEDSYSYLLLKKPPFIIDWQPMIIEILDDLTHLGKNKIAAKFHNTLADIMLNLAHQAQQQQKIVLSGGCFQNSYLTERCIKKLETAGFTVYTHEKVPPNDGGLALGQLYSTVLTG